MINKRFLFLAILWWVVISILFFLPGSAIPKNDWLGDIQFDKWVHVGFFGLLTWLWGRAIHLGKPVHLFGIILMAGLYGLLVEIVQDQWIVNRSFDRGDLLADTVGAVIGSWLSYRTYIKK